MKKVLLTMASLVMLATAAIAQTQDELPQLPTQHGLTDNQPAWGGSQEFNLSQGWNWWSTYVNVTDITALENALGTNGLKIKSSSSIAENANGTWSGNLTSIALSQMYFIQMANAYTATLTGSRANPTNVSIAVNNGWNWIGYPVTFTSTVADALTSYTPTNGDKIKGSSGISEYNAQSGLWTGSLSQLEPGKGYYLFSSNTTSTSFTYPATPASSKGMLTPKYENATEWQPDMATSHPFNMNMIAVISLNDEELRSENVEIGVFNGETCRGAMCPMYVEALDQYMVFLTMYGEDNEPYSFRLLDHETGEVYESNEAGVSFKADVVLGGLESPFELKFNTKASMSVAGTLQLFPNPVNRGEKVSMNLPGEGTMTVEVVNVMGSTVKSLRVAEGNNELAADMAPGIYTVKVTDAQGKVYVDKLIVK